MASHVPPSDNKLPEDTLIRNLLSVTIRYDVRVWTRPVTTTRNVFVSCVMAARALAHVNA